MYVRVSTDRQAERGYSVDGQLADLREHAAREGFKVVEEIKDGGEKRWSLDRPGVEVMRELAASGAIDQVWAWRWDRFGEAPWPEVLATELEEYGVSLRSLDDGGEGEDAEILRVLRSAMAKKERKRITERSRMGMFSKARRGEISGSTFKPRYGFQRVLNDCAKAVAYEVDEEKMQRVCTIFSMLAGGESIHGVQRYLERSGVPAPAGGMRWSRTTIKNMAQEDAYMPRTVEELESMNVPKDVLATLDENKVYGITWFGRRRSRYTGRGKARKVETQPWEKWIGIPVDLTGSGLERGVVEKARMAVKDNRSPSKVGDRFWQLTKVLYCRTCGRRMIEYRRKRKGGGYRYYYRCRPDSTLANCMNRKSHPAEALEFDAVRIFEDVSTRGTLLALYDKAVEAKESQLGLQSNLERRAALVERLSALDLERKNYLRQNARGILSDSELDTMLAEVDEERGPLNAELRATDDADAMKRRLQAARYSLVHREWYEDPDAVQPGEYLSFGASQEEVNRVYRQFGARFEVSEDGTLTLRFEMDLPADEYRCNTNAHIAQWSAGLG